VQQFSPRRLREAREAAGIRPEAAALQVDRSYQSVLSYELGRVTPPTPVLAAFAGLYGVTVDAFFDVEAVAAR
jgi:transcriptional regulator with XRE-family HTH domain